MKSCLGCQWHINPYSCVLFSRRRPWRVAKGVSGQAIDSFRLHVESNQVMSAQCWPSADRSWVCLQILWRSSLLASIQCQATEHSQKQSESISEFSLFRAKGRTFSLGLRGPFCQPLRLEMCIRRINQINIVWCAWVKEGYLWISGSIQFSRMGWGSKGFPNTWEQPLYFCIFFFSFHIEGHY